MELKAPLQFCSSEYPLEVSASDGSAFNSDWIKQTWQVVKSWYGRWGRSQGIMDISVTTLVKQCKCVIVGAARSSQVERET